MRRVPKVRLLLCCLSLCGLAWAVMLEAREASALAGFSVSGGVPYDRVFFWALLMLGAAFMLRGRPRGFLAAALSGGVVLAEVFRHFWHLARAGEVPPLGYRHLRLWWPNLEDGQLFQIALALAITAYAVASLRGLRGGSGPGRAGRGGGLGLR